MEEIMAIIKLKATCLKVLDNVKKTGKKILITKKGEACCIVSPVVGEGDWEALNIETYPYHPMSYHFS